MKILGTYKKIGNWYAAEIPLLLIHTQARTKKELVLMIKDALEFLVDSPQFKAEIEVLEDGKFSVGAKKGSTLLASAALRQQRAASQKSVRDVARELGSKSPNAYSRYESGKVSFTFDKFTQLLNAINGLEPVLTILPKTNRS